MDQGFLIFSLIIIGLSVWTFMKQGSYYLAKKRIDDKASKLSVELRVAKDKIKDYKNIMNNNSGIISGQIITVMEDLIIVSADKVLLQETNDVLGDNMHTITIKGKEEVVSINFNSVNYIKAEYEKGKKVICWSPHSVDKARIIVSLCDLQDSIFLICKKPFDIIEDEGLIKVKS